MKTLLYWLLIVVAVASMAGCTFDDNFTARTKARAEAAQAQAASRAQVAQAQAQADQARSNATMYQTLADAAQAGQGSMVLVVLAFIAFAGAVVYFLFKFMATQAQIMARAQERSQADLNYLNNQLMDRAWGPQLSAPDPRGYLSAGAAPRGHLPAPVAQVEPGPVVPPQIAAKAHQVGGLVIWVPDQGWLIIHPETRRIMLRPKLITVNN